MTKFSVCAALLMILCTTASASSLPKGFLGINTATWDLDVDTPQVTKLLADAGISALRFPGGSTSDDFDWTKPQATSTAHFAHLAEEIHAAVTVTINYGSGSPQMAAAWVAYCNGSPSSNFVLGQDASGRDWKTVGYWATLRSSPALAHDDGLNVLRANHPAPWHFLNWEIGNECYGSWENDTHTPKHDASNYAQFATAAMALMKRVNPSIRTGVVLENPGESYSSQESVNDLVTKQVSSEWMPLVFSGLASHNAIPDFVIFHFYPQMPGQESDVKLLESPERIPQIIGGIRQYISAYFPKRSAKIGVACTECNSVAFDPGSQSISEVNAKYYALAAEAALKSGCESFFWWDLHNGINQRKEDSTYGDYGILQVAPHQDEPYPAYTAIKDFRERHR